MSLFTNRRIFAAAILVGLADANVGCSNSTPVVGAPRATPTASPTSSSTAQAGPLTLTPSSVDLPSTSYTPAASVTITDAQPIATPLTFSYSDPTIAGVESSSASGNNGAFTVFGIALGSTSITASDALGSSGTLAVQTTACGRPDVMSPNPVLVNPTSGSTGVSPSIGTIYFGVYMLTGGAATM